MFVMSRKTMAVMWVLLGVALSRGDEGRQSAEPVPGPQQAVRDRLEQPDDPFLPRAHLERPRHQPPYVPPPMLGLRPSVQANVDAKGNNILGDAANEPSLAVDPNDPRKIAIGWRQFDNVASNFRQAGWAYSTDAGLSWTFPGVLEPGVFRSDPVLDSDADGNFYYYSLRGDFFCFSFKSTDGGRTWAGPTDAFGGDKAWLTIDKTDSVGRGNLYAAWSTAGNNFFPNQFTRSVDAAASWLDLIQIPPERPRWGTLTVDPQGDLYVSGTTGGDNFYVVKSTNAKFMRVTPSFDFTVQVDLGGGLVLGAGPNPSGLLGQVWVASDHSGGPTAGNIYLLASVDPPGTDPLDVMFSRSEDGGRTWSPPVRVNDDSPGRNAWQWFGTMSVAPNGRIDVIWNDTRNSGRANLSELFYASSSDGGRTWSANMRLSPRFDSHVGWPNQSKLGDYYDMVSDEVGANLAWAATFNGEQDVYFLRIGDFDCNGNGVSDIVDILNGTSKDFNRNGIPDECEGLGDLNCDDRFDGADIDPFFLALGNPAQYLLRFPECDALRADMNGDGAVNGADIDVFFEALGG